MTDPSLSGRPEPAAFGDVHVYCICGGVVLSTFLTWAGVDLGGVPGGDGAQMNELLRGMTEQYSVSGVRMTAGKIALVAALACAGLTWAETANVAKWTVRQWRLAAVGAAVVAALAVLLTWIDIGPPLDSRFGLYVALVAAGVLVFVTIRRLPTGAFAPPVTPAPPPAP